MILARGLLESRLFFCESTERIPSLINYNLFRALAHPLRTWNYIFNPKWGASGMLTLSFIYPLMHWVMRRKLKTYQSKPCWCTMQPSRPIKIQSHWFLFGDFLFTTCTHNRFGDNSIHILCSCPALAVHIFSSCALGFWNIFCHNSSQLLFGLVAKAENAKILIIYAAAAVFFSAQII